MNYNTLHKKPNILVVGLGLIGGSLALALRRAGYVVHGYNRSPQPLAYALQNGVVDKACQSVADYDVVFIALPPQATVAFMQNNVFKKGAIVADICGVKAPIEQAVLSGNFPFRYVGTHPMAGKEVSGVQNACADLFDKASMVITSNPQTNPEALAVIKGLTKDMGFARIVECSAELHDKKIAYTSQLAHIVSNAYVKNPEILACFGFTGGSYQDMTRIAGVDEGAWAELYLQNAQNVSKDIGLLIEALTAVNTALSSGDKAILQAELARGRKLYEARMEDAVTEGITLTALK